MRLTQSRYARKSDHRQPRSTARLQTAAFEALENRQLMSGSVALVSGILNITGDASLASSITVSLSGSKISASNGKGATGSYAASAVKGISVVGGAGADYVYIDNHITVPETISGGAGNDQITSGGGSVHINEGNGNVSVQARGTANTITAGNGNNSLSGSVGGDIIVAGDGNNSIYTSNLNDSIKVGNGNNGITANGGNDTIVAGNGKDSLNGGTGDDQIIVGTGLSLLTPGSGTNSIQTANKSDPIVNSGGKTTVTYLSSTSTTTSTNTSTGTTSNSSTGTTPIANTSTGTPVSTGSGSTPVIKIVSSVTTVGIAVVVNGLSSTLYSGSSIDANYQWNFGDANGEYNTLAGFNASHIYTSPGTYKITLTITNNLNQTNAVSTNVVISGDSRKAIYVDAANGNDGNSGLNTSSPLRTAAAADAKVTSNSEVFFARGETFNLSGAFKLYGTNILVGAYGSGSQPVINYTAPTTGAVIFSTNTSVANGVTIQDLTLTTLNGTQPNLTKMPHGVMAGGSDTSVLRCTFDYVEYAVNASGSPVGLTVIDNSAPVRNGIQGYFVWDQGVDTVVIGNTVNGSNKEHVLRTTGAVDLLIAQNNFSNYDGKGCIEMHVGDHAWIDDNIITGGDIRVGPLGLWNEPIDTTSDCVIQNNRVYNTDIAVYPGAQSISIRNNIVDTTGTGIIVQGQDGLGRQSADIRILNNTGINTGASGQFVKVLSYTNGILLENNWYNEPNLATGQYAAAPVYVNEDDLRSFTLITGNVWQQPAKILFGAQGGVNYVGGHYVTTAGWNAMSKVGIDYFSNVAITSAGSPVGSAVATIDSALPGVFGDINGKARPSSGWTAGAIQE